MLLARGLGKDVQGSRARGGGGVKRKRHGVLEALEVILGGGGIGNEGGRRPEFQGPGLGMPRLQARVREARRPPRSRSWLGFPTGPRSTDTPGEERPCPRPPYLRGERRHRRAEPRCLCTASSDSPAGGRVCSGGPANPAARPLSLSRPRGPPPSPAQPLPFHPLTGAAAPPPPRPGQPIHRPLRLLAPPTMEE